MGESAPEAADDRANGGIEVNGDASISSRTAEAEAAKNEANAAFKDKHFSQAVVGYTRAITLDPVNPVYYSNRAFAHIRMENFWLAITDATKAIELDPKFVKGYYRRGDANFALQKFKLAMRDFKQAARVAPKDPDLRRKLAECEREVKRMRFEDALAAPEVETIPLWQTIDLSAMPVDDSYKGPRMAGSSETGYEVTGEFVADMMEAFREQKNIHTRFAFQIVTTAGQIFRQQEPVVDVMIPDAASFTVCGDVHGQYYDLLHIFELNGIPSEDNPYLFNGDFVDRGSFSVEVILTLMAFKCLYPHHLHLARGNHETKGMNQIYGFTGEVKHKYNATLAELFRETFCMLPLAHVLNSKVLVVHGGLFSKDGVTLSDLRQIDRFREPPEEGLMCEMLWSDPQAAEGRSPSKRGVGVAFGPDVTKRFLEENDLSLIVRSHEVKDEGYEVEQDGWLITVFSAPNYCDQMGNKGAFVKFQGSDMTPQFTTFSAVPHPNVRPMAFATSFFNNMFGGF